MILLTSFQESRRLSKRGCLKGNNVTFYSVSRFQPKGFDYVDLPFLAAVDIHGKKLSLRSYKENPIQEYKDDLMEFYNSVWDTDIAPWSQTLDSSNIDVICCWCPFSESTRNQIKTFGTFVCHTGIVGQVINYLGPGIDVYLDMDRHNSLVSEYKPQYYKPFVV